jgi:hypothetical protein
MSEHRIKRTSKAKVLRDTGGSFSPRHVYLGLLDRHSYGCTDKDQRRRRSRIRPPLRAAGVIDRAAAKSNVPDELDPDGIPATIHRDNSDSMRSLRIQSFPLPGAPVELFDAICLPGADARFRISRRCRRPWCLRISVRRVGGDPLQVQQTLPGF